MGMMKPRSAVILTDYRTGGSFLSLALDSHPLIYCARAEPLSKTSSWWEEIGAAGAILNVIFSQEMAKVDMVKIIYRQCGDAVWQELKERKARVLHLVRQNELRASCSFLFHKRIRKGEVPRKTSRRSLHAFTPATKRVVPKPMKIPPNELLQLMNQRVAQRKSMGQKAQSLGLKVLRLTYAQIVGGEQAEATGIPKGVATKICSFLKVPYRSLRAPSRKVNAYPLWLLISNWRQVKEAIGKSEYKKWLVVEDEWKEVEGVWVNR